MGIFHVALAHQVATLVEQDDRELTSVGKVNPYVSAMRGRDDARLDASRS
jgi:hypothetical protein